LSPIDCTQVLKEIELYLDGELTGAACGEIKAHLSGCGSCMDRTEFRKRVSELVASKCGCEEVPSELLDRLRARLASVDPGPG